MPLFLVVSETLADGTRVCKGILQNGKTVSVQIPKECLCIESYSTQSYLSLSSSTQCIGGFTTFNQLLCQNSSHLIRGFSVWKNAFVISDFYGNTILISTKDGTKVEIAIRGPAPYLWKKSYPILSSRCQALCPICIQTGAFNSCSENSTTCTCSRGHSFQKKEATLGAPFSFDLMKQSFSWTTKEGLFYSETTNRGLWQTTKTLKFTDLISGAMNSESNSRKAEFVAMENEFFKFLGAESRTRFELRRISFINNDLYEEAFYKFYNKLLLRLWASSSSQNQNIIQPLLGWQGTSEKVARKKQGQLSAKEIFTFTSSQWALSSAKSACDAINSKGKLSLHNSECLIASIVLPGNVSPINQTTAEGNSYDSDAVSVLQDGISIRTNEQALPRYIFHFNSFVSTLRDDLKNADAVVLVFSGNSNGNGTTLKDQIKPILDEITTKIRKLVLEFLAIPQELQAWLCKYGFKIPNKLRVVTSNEGNEGNKIANNIIKLVHEEVGIEVPCLVWNQAQSSKHSIQTSSKVFLTSDKSKAIQFCIQGR